MKGLRHTINVLVFIVVSFVSFSQGEAEINESAGKLFEKEQYVDATPLYLQLLSLNPTSADYNFRYGACLLFNSTQKPDALRYLNFAVKEPGIDPRAFYFHGKALHLNYQFEDAKASYKRYLANRDKKDKRYLVEREIEMCDNGKKLLAQFTDIIVSEKQEIDNDKFFRLYKNMQTIGGDILVSAEFQSKLDKKKGHVPIVHFPPNAKAIYYSSYGDDESTGKDIFIRRRLPNGGWGDPQILPGAVNTNEDEDFPYMHPSGDFLYFSSRGHNSMGGYDVFFSRFNPNINGFGKPENVDFAISSPDDDLFYVVDSLHKNAYFASSRQSQNGKLHVYNVRVARVPIQEVIVMGDFLSEINPDNKSMFVTVTSNTNGAEVGKIKSNAKGKYSFVFPKGGKYNYEVTVDGSEDVYKFLVELPYLDEFRPLKQKAIHAMVDGVEIVRIVNLFNEEVEGAEAIIADVIRKRATLDVNVDQFDLKELDAQLELNSVLAEMGFKDMSLLEVSDQLGELAITEKLKQETANRIESNLSVEIIEKSDRIKQLDDEINGLLTKAESTSSVGEKHEILLQAQRLEVEKNQLAQEIKSLDVLIDQALETTGNADSEVGVIQILENKYNALLAADKEEEALKLLAKNKDAINNTRSLSPNQMVNDLVAKSLKLTEEINGFQAQQTEFEKTKSQLKSELVLLKNEYANAKKKDFDRLRNEIAEKESEIEMVSEYQKQVKANITEKNIELGVLDNNIASLQKAMLNEDIAAIDKAKVDASIKNADDVVVEIENNAIESQLAELVEQNPELNPDYIPVDGGNDVGASQVASIQEDYQERKAEILADDNQSELEKNKTLLALNETAQNNATSRKEQIEQAISIQGESEQLNTESAALQNLMEELKSEQTNIQATISDIENPSVALSVEDVIAEFALDYTADKQDIQSSDKTELEKAEALQSLETELLDDIQNELEGVEKDLKKNADDTELLARKEMLSELAIQKNSEIAELNQTINALNQTSSVLTEKSVMDKVAPGYEESLKDITSNQSLNETERLEAEQSLEKRTVNQLKDQLAEVDKALRKDDANTSLIAEKGILGELIESKERRIEQLENQIDALDNVEVPELSSADVLSEVAPNYESDKNEIVNNSSFSELEREEALLKHEEELVDDLLKELAQINESLTTNENDKVLQAKKTATAQLLESTQASVVSIENKITQLKSTAETNSNTTEVTVERSEIEAALNQELVRSYQNEKGALLEEGNGDFASNEALLALEVNQLNALQTKKEAIEKQLAKSPEDVQSLMELEVINELIDAQVETVASQKDKAIESISALQVIEYQKKVDNDYPFDIAAINGSTSENKAQEAVDREQELQARLEKAIDANKKKLSRSYSVTIDLENLVLERAINESKERENEAKANVPDTHIADTQKEKTEFIEQIRDESLGEGDQSMTQEYTTINELKAHDQVLAFYEEQLEAQLVKKTQELESTEDKDNVQSEIDWVNEEIEAVAEKRRRISVSIGTLEQRTIANKSSQNSDEEIATLENKVVDLEAQLSSSELSKSERSKLEKELIQVENDIVVRENTVISNQIETAQKENESIAAELAQFTSESSKAQKAVESNSAEQKLIEQLVEDANDSKSEAEKNYLLNQAALKQEILNAEVASLVKDEKINELEEQNDVSLTSREELEQKRRTFTVRIGDLSTEIIQVEGQIEQAKKKELPALETRKASLVAEKALVEAQLREVEERLLEVSNEVSVISPQALETELSFNEERKLASNENYKEYYLAANEALDIEEQIGKLELEIKKEQTEVNQLLAGSDNEDEILLKVNNIKTKQAEIQRLNIDLIQKKYEAENKLPENKDDAMKMQNLIMRGVQPLKVAAVAAAIIQMPTTGLAINESEPSIYSAENPIPVGVEAPSGLVYRVQIGAFAKPIPQDLFKEFNPVSGEKIGTTNITRYMAGFFNNSEDVVNARTQIRGLGYSDAFVVAYCDGERIGFGEARRREAAGTCVPKGTNEMMIEVATNTAIKLGLPLTNEVQDVPELTYNQAPGAVEAEPIELKKGLFFTVQIGVFNRPVSEEEIFNLPDVLTIRLPNGQMRYASGIFDSAEEALPRQDEARIAGIQGPFITAYFEGERISIANARRILIEQGEGVLQSNIEKNEVIEVVETPTNVIRTDSVTAIQPREVTSEITEEYIQIVTKKKFNDFPRDVLNRYNAEGNFYFDAKDSLVKSIIYSNVDDLPRLYNFRNDIDTVYIPRDEVSDDNTVILSVKLNDSLIPGDFMDWLLRFNYRREFVKTEQGRELRIFGIEPNEVEKVQNDVRIFALEAVIVEETIYELELNENK